MIAKRVPSKKNTGSFKVLSNYITRSGDDKDSVSYKITNVNFDSYSLALKEIEATQKRNTRSKKDKTYHLVVSFPKDEKPNDKIISEIEETLCKSIGLKDHQRISAIHDDTENYHFHVAINKIHPVSFNSIEPYFDKQSLVRTCAEIEEKYNLTPVCSLHDRNIKQFSNQASQMHSHSNLDSFELYLKDRKDLINESLDKSNSWAEFQNALKPIGIFVKMRGAGAVFSTLDSKYHGPCSRTDRNFSKAALESKLGDFVQTKIDTIINSEKYSPKGSVSQKNENLWDEYNSRKNLKTREKKRLQENKKINLSILKTNYFNIRSNIKNSSGGKKRKYSTASLENKRATDNIRSTHNKKIRDLNEAHPFSTWQTFLVQKSNEGDIQALNALRKKKQYEPTKNQISSDKEGEPLLSKHSYSVNKAGEVVYQFTGVTVKDSGEKLAVSIKEDKEDAGMLNALLFAQEKYGDNLAIDGDRSFKAKAVEIAVAVGLPVRFTDPDMEASRKALAELKGKSQPINGKQGKSDIQSFIDKRNETRKKVSSIPQHRKYEASDEGKISYVGTRKLQTCNVALYEKGGEILVCPLSKSQHSLLSKLKVGTQVMVSRSTIKVDENKGREI